MDELNALECLIKYLERQAQIDALVHAQFKLFPFSERNGMPSQDVLEKRLQEIIEKVRNGERL